jgi:predicted metal-dependent hydrolase
MTIDMDGIPIELTRKRMRTIRLTLRPPDGQALVSAPMRTSLAEIKDFLATRVTWIRKHQERMRGQLVEPAREYLPGERHLLWGQAYDLVVEPVSGRASVLLRDNLLVLLVKPDSTLKRREALVKAWYRRQLEAALPPLATAWEARLGVKAAGFSLWQMKSRWGSCNPRTALVRLNLELARKPPECLEYVLVHELVHLLEASHGPRFKALMDRFMPDWRERRKRLNSKGFSAPEGSSSIS